jgi:hypothetical protein
LDGQRLKVNSFTVTNCLDCILRDGECQGVSCVLTVTLDAIGSLGSSGVLENLLDVHVHLAEHGRRYSAAIGFVGEQGHALLNAERLEDCLGDAEWKAVEWPDENDAVEAFICGVQALAYGRTQVQLQRPDVQADRMGMVQHQGTTGVVWDYLRLELNDGSKAYPAPPDNQRPDYPTPARRGRHDASGAAVECIQITVWLTTYFLLL